MNVTTDRKRVVEYLDDNSVGRCITGDTPVEGAIYCGQAAGKILRSSVNTE